MSDSPAAIVAQGLVKQYKTTRALDGFDLEVPTGTIFGLLGPNGAGKSTAVRILSTLVRFDAGRATVAGFDVERQSHDVRARIGLAGQHAAVDEVLSGEQNLTMFGRLYHLDRRTAAARAQQLLEQFDLVEAARKPVKQYSGGMRRRLDLAASLILAPQVLFLDEPTTGLDARSRTDVWEAVRGLVAGGTTVLLTTQYLEEADQLADHIAVIDHGRVIARGTPDELKAQLGGDRIDVVVRHSADLERAGALVAQIAGVAPDLTPHLRLASAPVKERVPALVAAVQALQAEGIDVEDIALRRPSMDEVFLHLTGSPRAINAIVNSSADLQASTEVAA